ncbi:MAG: DUF2490 domain-containing protein [Pyrinomonadaceae bacterium]
MNFTRLLILLAILVVGGFCHTAVAQDDEDFQQSQDDEDVQSWNEIQLTVPMGKRVDFLTKLTMRIGKDVTRLNSGRIAIGYVWKPIKQVSVSPLYTFVNGRNSAGLFTIENRLSIAGAYRFPVRRFGLTHRSTIERRFRVPVNSWRYRAQFMIDKDISEKVIPKAKFFLSNEVFYHSITRRFSRNRFSAGITKTLTDNVALDLFYMRQNDGTVQTGDLNIIGTAWKIRM